MRGSQARKAEDIPRMPRLCLHAIVKEILLIKKTFFKLTRVRGQSGSFMACSTIYIRVVEAVEMSCQNVFRNRATITAVTLVCA